VTLETLYQGAVRAADPLHAERAIRLIATPSEIAELRRLLDARSRLDELIFTLEHPDGPSTVNGENWREFFIRRLRAIREGKT